MKLSARAKEEMKLSVKKDRWNKQYIAEASGKKYAFSGCGKTKETAKKDLMRQLFAHACVSLEIKDLEHKRTSLLK